MEIDITEFFNNADPFDYAHSAMEGGPNAGANTWRAAREARWNLLDTPEKRETFADYLVSAGYSERPADDEVNALFLQWISGDIRESGLDCDPSDDDWQAYYADARDGRVSGNLFRADDSKIYYSFS